MGLSQSSISSGTVSASKTIAEAFLYITQDISQGVQNLQIVGINCQDNTTNDLCIGCLRALENAEKGSGKSQADITKDAQNLCVGPCSCNISNIDLNQIISVDFSALSNVNVSQSFQNAISNSIYNQAYQQQGNLSFDNKEDTLSQISSNILTTIQNGDLSDLQQALKNVQVVQLNSPGELINVQLNQAIDITSSFFANSSQFS